MRLAGMFFELFLLFTVFIVGFSGFGLAKRKWWPLIVVFFLMLMTGSLLVSEGLRYESGSHFDQGSGDTFYVYDVLRVEQDSTVAILGWSYFWGSWLLLAGAVGAMAWGRFAGVE